MSAADDPLPAQPTQDHYPGLDPLRFFAALSVLLFHLHDVLRFPLPAWPPLLWFRGGFLGVDLFFAISGAVIALSLQRLAARNPAGWRRAFVTRRLARLLPLYLLTGALFLLIVRPETLQRPDIAATILAQLLFLQNLFVSTHGVINGPSWSLGVEMQFYVVMLLCGPWLLARPWGRRLLACFVLAAAWRAGVWLWAQATPVEHIGPRVFIYTSQLPGVFDGFGAGIAAALWRQTRSPEQATRLFPWLAVAAVLAWTLMFGLMLAFIEHYWQGAAMLIGLRALTAAAAGLSVAAAMCLPPRADPGATGRLLGDLSYGIYLWHMLALLWWRDRLPDTDPLLLGIVVAGSSVALAVAGWYALERPILRWAQRR